MTPDTPDLVDLIEAPNENEANEYKCWMDLADKRLRRDIARHIAALANYGGGYLIFGFHDEDLSADTNIPENFKKTYTHDYINDAIVSRYLEPPVHCDVVHLISPSTGNKHALIRVPAHGATPVCLKKGGTSFDGSTSDQVQVDTYYVRKPGPKSEPILKAMEWKPIFQRCVLHERDHLSALIQELINMLQSATPQEKSTPPESSPRAGKIAQLAEEAFLAEITGSTRKMTRLQKRWPVSLKTNHYILSYSISHSEQHVMPRKELLEELARINREVRQLVWTGWSMFYPFTRSEIAPQYRTEGSDGSGTYFLETNLGIGDCDPDITLSDFWRVSPKGWATLVRAYREDRSGGKDRGINQDWKPGTWLSPETPIRETAELVRHAYLFSKCFTSATSIEFDCQWKGLNKRELKDSEGYWRQGRISQSDIRKTSRTWPITDLIDNWPNVVAELSCPLLEMFDFDICSPDLVHRMEKRFRKLPPDHD